MHGEHNILRLIVDACDMAFGHSREHITRQVMRLTASTLSAHMHHRPPMSFGLSVLALTLTRTPYTHPYTHTVTLTQ